MVKSPFCEDINQPEKRLHPKVLQNLLLAVPRIMSITTIQEFVDMYLSNVPITDFSQMLNTQKIASYPKFLSIYLQTLLILHLI